MTLRTLQQFAEDIVAHKDDPHSLAEDLLEMTAKYSYLSEEWKPLKMAKNSFWVNTKYDGEKKSDKEVELLWGATDDGQKEIRLILEMKALEKLMSSVKSFLRVAENEAKNNW